MRIVLGCIAALALAPAAVAAPGVSQTPGKAGCVAAKARGCARVPALRSVSGIAVSPDGRSVYVAASKSGSLVWFARDRRSGRLRRAGALSGLDGVRDVVLSPDGRDVYAAAHDSGTLVHLRRDRRTGALAQAGCVGASEASGCAAVEPLLADVDDVSIARGGRVVIATVEGEEFDSTEPWRPGAVVALRRDPADGGLTPSGCLVLVGTTGCPGGDVLFASPRAPAAVAPTGRNLYVTSPSGVRLAQIADDGRLVPGACFAGGTQGCRRVPRLGDPEDWGPVLTLSLDGRHLYAAGFEAFTPFAVVAFSLDRTTGYLGASTCLAAPDAHRPARGCPAMLPPHDPMIFAPSPDGRLMAIAEWSYDAVGVLTRSPRTGALTPTPGRRGCIGDRVSGRHFSYPRSCGRGHHFHGASALAWSPDGRFVYVAAESSVAVLRVSDRP